MIHRLALVLSAGVALLFASPATAAEEVTGELPVVLDAARGLVEEHLQGVLNGLQALAVTQDVTSGDWERIRVPLNALGAGVSTRAAMWYARPDGSYLTVEKGKMGATLSDRDYFPALMKGEHVLGSLVVSKSTGERSVVVATPVLKGAKVVGALGATLSAPKLAKLVDDQLALPEGVIFYALDQKGLTALHRETPLIFQYPSDVGDPSLKDAVRQMLAEPKGTVHYTFRGARRNVLFQRSDRTGWVFAVGRVTEP